MPSRRIPRARLTFKVKGVVTQIDTTGPLHGAGNHARRPEDGTVLQADENTSVEIRCHVKQSPFSCLEFHLEGEIRSRVYTSDKRTHMSAFHLNGSILKISSPLTANCQFAISSSRCISIQACTKRLLREGKAPANTSPFSMLNTACSPEYSVEITYGENLSSGCLLPVY